MLTQTEPSVQPHARVALESSDLRDGNVWKPSRRWHAARNIRSIGERLLFGAFAPPLDAPKLWDARNVLDVFADLPRNAPVLDCGGFASLPLLALWDAGFRNLSAIDLNPGITELTLLRGMCPSVQDIQHTAYADASFAAVVCSSTIEHGVSWDAFLAEAARLLQPGGRLYLSTDLVAQDACTTGLEEFGLPWTPLRPADLATIGERFVDHGFDVPLPGKVGSLARLPVRFLGVPMGVIAFVTVRRGHGR